MQSHSSSNSNSNSNGSSNSNSSGGSASHHGKSSIVRDCQVLLHMLGSCDPFGAVAIDERTDKLSYVRQAIDKHFKEVMQLSDYVFISKDGAEIQLTQEKEMLVCSQIYVKVCVSAYENYSTL